MVTAVPLRHASSSRREEWGVRKLLVVVLVLFLGYWLVQAPQSFADFARDTAGWLWSTLQSIFRSVIDVLDSLGR